MNDEILKATLTEIDLYEATREIARLRGLLEPFIAAADDADGYPDSHPIGADPAMRLAHMTVGDLRAVRTALK